MYVCMYVDVCGYTFMDRHDLRVCFACAYFVTHINHPSIHFKTFLGLHLSCGVFVVSKTIRKSHIEI